MNSQISGFLDEYNAFAKLISEYAESYAAGFRQHSQLRAQDKAALLQELSAIEQMHSEGSAQLDASIAGELDRLTTIEGYLDGYESRLNKKNLDKARRERDAGRAVRMAASAPALPLQAALPASSDPRDPYPGPEQPQPPQGQPQAAALSPGGHPAGIAEATSATIASMDSLARSNLPKVIADVSDFLQLPFRQRKYDEVVRNRDELEELMLQATDEMARAKAENQARMDADVHAQLASLRERDAALEQQRAGSLAAYLQQLKILLLDGLEERLAGDTSYSAARDDLARHLASCEDASPDADPAKLCLGMVSQPAVAADDGTLDAFLSRILPDGVYGNGSMVLPLSLSRYFARAIFVSYYAEYVGGIYPLFSNYALQLMRLFGEEGISTYLVDCSNAGARYAQFSACESEDDDRRVCIVRTAEEAHEVLASLQEYVIESTSTYLKDAYPDVEAYNRASAIKREVKALFVSSISELSADDLATLTLVARNGARCGVLVFIGASTDEFQESGVVSRSHARAVNNLAALCDRIFMGSDGKMSLGNGAPDLSAPPDAAPEVRAAVIERIVRAQGKPTVLPVEEHLPGAAEAFSGDCSEHLLIPIGQTPQGTEYTLDFHKDASYMLIGGNPSAGKSSVLHTVILQSAMRYRPEDLEIYIADLKDGSEFDSYVQLGVRSVRAVLDDAEEDLAVSFLEFVNREISRRLTCFEELEAATGRRIRNIEEFYEVNRDSGNPVGHIPRLLLIIDEFQSLYSGNRKTGELTNWMLRMGRTAGVAVIFSSQRSQADSAAMSSSFGTQTKEYFIYRMAFKLPYAGAKDIMNERCSDTGRENPALRKAQTLKPGQAIVNSNMGATEEDNQLIQCYYPSSDAIVEISRLVSDIQGRGEGSVVLGSEKPVTSARPSMPGRAALGESNRFHADDSASEDAFSDDMVVSLDMSYGALGVYGISEKAVASAVSACAASFMENRQEAACLVLGEGRMASAALEALPDAVCEADAAAFSDSAARVLESGRPLFAVVAEPHAHPELKRDALGRDGAQLASLLSLIANPNAFLIVCSDNIKKMRDDASWADTEIPHRILSVGNPATLRLMVAGDAADKIKEGSFNSARSNVIKAYYYNKETGKLGRMRMYPPQPVRTSPPAPAPAESPGSPGEGWAGLAGN